ncbi:MAG: Gfo/Idh/MocA family protein [Phototrophicaceae bacterium]
MAEIKLAMIGAGWWGTQFHIPALIANERVDFVLIDKNPQALKAAADTYHLEHTYTSLADALNDHHDLRGAVVSVPHHAHYAVAKEALESGLHIMLEKPMTLWAREAKELVDIAAKQHLEIMIGYIFPYIDTMVEAKRYMDEGRIGEVEYITCSMSSMTVEFLRGKPEEYAGVFNYPVTGPTAQTYADPHTAGGGQAQLQITHSVEMMFHLAHGLRAERVTAFMNNLDAQVDIVDAFAVRMNNGAVATVGSTGNIGKGDSGLVEVHLHGSKGRLYAEAIKGELYMRLHDGTEVHRITATPGYPAEKSTEQFVKMLLDGAPNLHPGYPEGLYTVELLDAAYRSAAQDGMPVSIESLYN